MKTRSYAAGIVFAAVTCHLPPLVHAQDVNRGMMYDMFEMRQRYHLDELQEIYNRNPEIIDGAINIFNGAMIVTTSSFGFVPSNSTSGAAEYGDEAIRAAIVEGTATQSSPSPKSVVNGAAPRRATSGPGCVRMFAAAMPSRLVAEMLVCPPRTLMAACASRYLIACEDRPGSQSMVARF